jgi:magnesium chelatase family protein
MTTTGLPPWAPDAGQARGAAVTGTTGHAVGVHARISNGPASFAIAGVRDSAAEPMRDRVRAAVLNSGLPWPGRAVTVGVHPPGLPCAGLDLAVAVAILTAAGTIPPDPARSCVLAADLGLDGRLRLVRGVLPAVTAAAAGGAVVAVTAPGDAAEAALVPGLAVVPCPDLRAVVTWLGGGFQPGRPPPAELSPADARAAARLAASPAARLAAQAAAAGGHHLGLTGPRGHAPRELAAGVRLLMPGLDEDQAGEVSAIYSAAGLLDAGSGLITRPPLRNPHHTASLAAMTGGGSGITRPGEAALAHCGVLLLDQAPELARDVLAALRPVLADGQAEVRRHGLITRFPARFTLIAAISPCPCGGQPGCPCTPLEARRYQARAGTEIGSHLTIRLRTAPDETTPARPAEPADLEIWAAQVADARDRARRRLAATPWRLNAEIPGPEIARSWRPAAGAFADVARAADLGQISTRSAIGIARLAWTMADLAGKPRPGTTECRQALAFRLATPS